MLLNGRSVSRETQERLQHFAALFNKWAKSINLVAPSTLGELWERHIADSAQIFQLSPGAANWVDLGSGGGFPGIITAIFLAEMDQGWIHLIESNQKKSAFLRVALSETNARGSIHTVRAEAAISVVAQCDRISARALADLDTLLGYSSSWMIDKETRAFFHKGRDYRRELADAHSRWSFDLLEHNSAIENDSVILEISNLRHKAL
jgi:16S rRNA (guanine527-N7)-methyltransferase